MELLTPSAFHLFFFEYHQAEKQQDLMELNKAIQQAELKVFLQLHHFDVRHDVNLLKHYQITSNLWVLVRPNGYVAWVGGQIPSFLRAFLHKKTA